jgi:hypothetical protein
MSGVIHDPASARPDSNSKYEVIPLYESDCGLSVEFDWLTVMAGKEELSEQSPGLFEFRCFDTEWNHTI